MTDTQEHNLYSYLRESLQISWDNILHIIGSNQKGINGVSDQDVMTVISMITKKQTLDRRKDQLTILCNCLDNGLFKNTNDSSFLLPRALVDIMSNINVESSIDFELWSRGFDHFKLISNTEIEDAFNTRQNQISGIFKLAFTSKFSNDSSKIQALSFIQTVFKNHKNQDVLAKQLLSIYHNCIIPSMFKTTNTTLQNEAISAAFLLQPFLPLDFQKSSPDWKSVHADISHNYVPIIQDMVKSENETFEKLWIFVIKTLCADLLKTTTPINEFLAILEKAFKCVNVSIKMKAFHCWQVIIQCFATCPLEFYNLKRIKLLTIPLKTNNSKTEELIRIKFETWLMLMNFIGDRLPDYSVGVVDNFLNFCFGPLNNVPLVTYFHPNMNLPMGGKKFPDMHVIVCKVFLKLLLDPKESESIQCDLKVNKQVINEAVFLAIKKMIINSCVECSVLMSGMKQSNKQTQELVTLHESMWGTILHYIDNISDSTVQSEAIGDLSNVIIALVNLCRKSLASVNFCISSIFSLLTCGKFKFCKLPVMTDKLFVPMIALFVKKDCYIPNHLLFIFKESLMLKKTCEDYPLFFKRLLQKLHESFGNKTNDEKHKSFCSVWQIIADHIIKDKPFFNLPDEQETLTIYQLLMSWPIQHCHYPLDETTIEKWKTVYGFLAIYMNIKSFSKLSSTLATLLINFSDKHQLFTFLHIIIEAILSFSTFPEDSFEDVSAIIQTLNLTITSANEPQANIIVQCVSDVFEKSYSAPYLSRIFLLMIESVSKILNIFKKYEILNSIVVFLDRVTPSEDIDINALLKCIKTNTSHLKIDADVFDKLCSIFTVAEMKFTKQVTQNKFDLDIEREQPSKQLILFNYNVDTMTPVKLKGSRLNQQQKEKVNKSSNENTPATRKSNRIKDNNGEFVVINSPFKGPDMKKLTKSQREKLKRKNDDIPALYEDLSRSQSQILVDTNSNSCTNQIITGKDDGVVEVQSNGNDKSGDDIKDTIPETETQNNSPSTKTLDDEDEEKKRKRLAKIDRELSLIKMDIVGGDSLAKVNVNESRKTRHSSTFRPGVFLNPKRRSSSEQEGGAGKSPPGLRRSSSSLGHLTDKKRTSPARPSSSLGLLTDNIVKKRTSPARPSPTARSPAKSPADSKSPPASSAPTPTPTPEIIENTQEVSSSTSGSNTKAAEAVARKKPAVKKRTKKIYSTTKNARAKMRRIKRARQEIAAATAAENHGGDASPPAGNDISLEDIEADSTTDQQQPKAAEEKADDSAAKADDAAEAGADVAAVADAAGAAVAGAAVAGHQHQPEQKLSEDLFGSLLTISFSKEESVGGADRQQQQTKEDETYSVTLRNDSFNLVLKKQKRSSLESNDSKADASTQSVPMETQEELPEQLKNDKDYGKEVCRRVLFASSSDEIYSAADDHIGIVSSPVGCDTPTRNKELMDNTQDISPIRSEKNVVASVAAAVTAAEPTDANADDGESPDLFSGGEMPSGRAAQMMGLVSAKPVRAAKLVIETRRRLRPTPLKNTSSRTDRMLTKAQDVSEGDRNGNDTTKTISSESNANKSCSSSSEPNADETVAVASAAAGEKPNFLEFIKVPPLPTASPRYGILKRKEPDYPDEGIAPSPKKKKGVSYCDPVVTDTKLVEKISIRNNHKKRNHRRNLTPPAVLNFSEEDDTAAAASEEASLLVISSEEEAQPLPSTEVDKIAPSPSPELTASAEASPQQGAAPPSEPNDVLSWRDTVDGIVTDRGVGEVMCALLQRPDVLHDLPQILRKITEIMTLDAVASTLGLVSRETLALHMSKLVSQHASLSAELDKLKSMICTKDAD